MIAAVLALVYLLLMPLWIFAAAQLPEPQCYVVAAMHVPVAMLAMRTVLTWSRGTR